MEDFTKPAEDLSKEAAEYVELRLQKMKLRTVKDLSTVLGRFFGMLVLLITVMTAVITAAFGCILVIGEEIGSYAAGAFIVAGIFCIAAAALFAFRKRLFRNTFVRLFIKLFFDNNE